MDNNKIIELVKKIRAELGLGIMEIKSALEEADGDEKKAKEILKEKGFKKAESKAERETHQGRVATYTHATGKIGVMVELLCETDFVAKHEDFLALTKDLCLQIAAMNPETVEDLMKQEFIKDPSKTIEEMVKTLISKFGENMKINRFARFEI
ncbi:MAG TPA: translation elongation factor Ts [Candidatus Woesebacteria bacterium]|nr:translation elongation factor Ts [Candidatus Woesebacteria bacterium]